MTQQLLPETPEKTQQHVEGRETRLDSAQSFQGGLHPVAQLQRALGNRNVAKLIQAKRLTPEGKIIGLQRKLTVGAADDQYEQEADRVARQVMNAPDAVAAKSMQRAMSQEEDKDKMLQTKPLAASITPFVQRQMVKNEEPEDKEKLLQAKFFSKTSRESLQLQPEADEKEKEKEPIQAKSSESKPGRFEAGGEVETLISQSKGRGSPLPDSVRAYMEPRFGVDFSDVRIHTGSDALQLNRNVGAQAFTHSSDIYYGEGRSPSNLELTAHELTHVIQQTRSPKLQTRKRGKEPALPRPHSSIQRICTSCAADDREAKGAESIARQTKSTASAAPSSENVPAVASVEAIQSKIADLIKLKPKKDAYGEENAADRATIIKSIKEIREAIEALKASDLGINTDELKALKAQFYLQINKATPSYFQMENLDILWIMDKGKRATAPGRTCNVTALSISLESLGVSPLEFKGDKELLKLIWKYQQDQMSEISQKDEETAISKLKEKTKEKQEAALRAKGEKERTRLAALDLDGLRMPDFMQLIVIYNVLLKTGKVTGKMNGLGLDAGTIKAMAADQPDKFKETMDSAHGLARNSILFSGQFPDFAGWFGIKANSRPIKYSDQLDKMGEFGRARWKVHELQGHLSETEQKAGSAEGKSKARLEKEAKYLRSNIDARKSKIDYTITEQEQELASLQAKAGRATGDEQATLTAQAGKLAANIEARKGKQQDKITKMEAELEKLKAQQSEGAKGKAAAALEKKIKAKQGQIDELKSPTSIQSMDQFETMVPLKDYKNEVTSVFVPILSAGKHVEVNLHNHFVHLFEINDNGPVVDEVGEGAGKRLQLSWEKARALGYFQSSTVYEK